MSGIFATTCALAACATSGTAGACLASACLKRKSHSKATRNARRRTGADGKEARSNAAESAASAREDRVLAYAQQLTRRLFVGATEPLTPSVRKKAAGKTRAGRSFKERALRAGCSKSVSVSAYCEACTRLAVAGALAGALAGASLSNELALVLGVVCGFIGYTLPTRSVDAAMKRRAVAAEEHLSEMLEVIALGLRSGLTFDRSFALYGIHFDNELARSCTKAYRQWELGLMTRDEALREFARSFDCDQLGRIVESSIRSLRFGTTLVVTLEDAAVQARETYRSKLAERVAKAPVKMMLPTGTLILPSMLLLVLGPIVIELISGF